MPLLMFEGLTARIVQVLQDYLVTELANVDTDAGGAATPPPLDYFEWDRPSIVRYPAIALVPGRSKTYEVKSKSFGDRLHADYNIDLKAQLAIDTASDDAMTLQRWAFRYGVAMVRILCDQKDGLETIADPVRYVSRVKLRDEVDWGVPSTQKTGQQTRTVVVPIAIERIESRTGAAL